MGIVIKQSVFEKIQENQINQNSSTMDGSKMLLPKT